MFNTTFLLYQKQRIFGTRRSSYSDGSRVIQQADPEISSSRSTAPFMCHIRDSELTYDAGLYTDESPGLKVDPFVVLVLSVGFIISVVGLHSKHILLSVRSPYSTDNVQSLQRSPESSLLRFGQLGLYFSFIQRSRELGWRIVQIILHTSDLEKQYGGSQIPYMPQFYHLSMLFNPHIRI